MGNYSSTEKAVKLYSCRSFIVSPGVHKLIRRFSLALKPLLFLPSLVLHLKDT